MVVDMASNVKGNSRDSGFLFLGFSMARLKAAPLLQSDGSGDVPFRSPKARDLHSTNVDLSVGTP
jgi:hypothetical protein